MSSRKHRDRRSAPVADSEIDPDRFFAPVDARDDRKVQQLCREVERTLSYAFGECTDRRVRELAVMAVDPAPDGSRLQISVLPSGPIDHAATHEALLAARSFFRAEIAAAIQRKRTPELVFHIVARDVGPELE